MPIRLLKPYNGQAANTLYFGPSSEEDALLATGGADNQPELASDYAVGTRPATAAAVSVVRSATTYLMNSGSAQTLTLNGTGYWPLEAVITVIQMGAGATTVVAGTGITILKAASSLVTAGQYSVGQLIKTGPSTWVAFGGFGG